MAQEHAAAPGADGELFSMVEKAAFRQLVAAAVISGYSYKF